MQIKNDILMLASTLHSNPKFLYISSEEEVGSKIPSDGVLKSLLRSPSKSPRSPLKCPGSSFFSIVFPYMLTIESNETN